jgi:hypothetical protein
MIPRYLPTQSKNLSRLDRSIQENTTDSPLIIFTNPCTYVLCTYTYLPGSMYVLYTYLLLLCTVEPRLFQPPLFQLSIYYFNPKNQHYFLAFKGFDRVFIPYFVLLYLNFALFLLFYTELRLFQPPSVPIG